MKAWSLQNCQFGTQIDILLAIYIPKTEILNPKTPSHQRLLLETTSGTIPATSQGTGWKNRGDE
ncbi:MAG: hypothetical protein COA52_03215 [Hyphomicrobiales bacterium]|nr:MAG: hypothetical protein COA52_03215 [Hyphomicrobiales bacterium]